jgi:hypothetical protein
MVEAVFPLLLVKCTRLRGSLYHEDAAVTRIAISYIYGTM